jgi:hypothetical protein
VQKIRGSGSVKRIRQLHSLGGLGDGTTECGGGTDATGSTVSVMLKIAGKH